MNSTKRLALLFLATVIFAMKLSAGSDPLETWRWRNPLPQGNDLQNLAFANGLFFAMGEAGTLITSSNGLDWSAQFVDSSQKFHGVSWGAGIYVALGTAGAIFTSSNAKDWSWRASGPLGGLSAVAYGAGLFVAVGPFGAILTSPDGATWTVRNNSGPWFRGIGFNNGLFVATADFGVYTSRDGIQWTFRYEDSGRFAYGNQRWVMTVQGGNGTVAVSTDGIHWIQAFAGGKAESVAFGNGQFVALNTFHFPFSVSVSTNGFTWEVSTLDEETFSDFYAGSLLTWGAGRFVVTGRNGRILTSTNGIEWSRHANTNGPYGPQLLKVTVGNGSLVAVSGDGTIISGELSGGPMQQRQVPIDPPEPFALVTFNQDTFVAITEAGTIVHSTDATNWWRPEDDVRFFPRERVRDVLHMTGRDYYVGEFEGVWLLENGSNFVEVISMDVSGRGIAYGNGCFVTVIGDSTCRSADGTNWTRTAHPESPDFTTVAFGDGRFVAMGNGGWFATSTNGSDWSFSSLGLTDVAHVLWNGSEFVAVVLAPFLGNAPQFILSSTNGEDWLPHSLPVSGATLNHAVSAEGQLHIVGGNGTVLQSAPRLAPRLDIRVAAGAIEQIRINGTGGLTGATYRILTATNLALPLAQWTPIVTGQISASGGFGYTNDIQPDLRAQYFRVILP